MTIDRRTFIGQVATGVVAASSLGSLVAQMKLQKIGVQLYTLRSEMEKDVEKTLASVSAAGFAEVEFAGYFNKPAAEIRAILDRHKLTSPSAHIDFNTISTKLPQVLSDSHTIGHKYIVMPYLDDTLRAQPDIYKRVADTLNKAGAESAKAGITMAYHNHNFEFVPVNGVTPFDMLLKACDPKLVKFELDLCWATAAGQDPVAVFKKNPGRFPMVHVKGLTKKPAGASTPIPEVLPNVSDVGAPGDVVDWKGIFAASKIGGIEHYFVEHDVPKAPLESIKNSYAYLRALTF